MPKTTAIDKLTAALTRAGLSWKRIQLTTRTPGIYTQAVAVYHDYTGLYPGEEVYQQHSTAGRIATKYGYNYEQRGHYSATFIY